MIDVRRLALPAQPESAVRHGNDSGAFELSRDLFPGRERKPEARSGQRILTGWDPFQARLDVEGEPPAEKSKDGVLGADLLRASSQCAHHFFIQARGIAQRKFR